MRALFIGLCWALPALAWGTEYCTDTVIDCKSLTPAACSDQVLTALGHDGVTLKLKAATPTDTVHGHVTIVWAQPPAASQVCVTYYDQDEASNGKHKSTFKKPNVIPDKGTVQTQLDAVVVP